MLQSNESFQVHALKFLKNFREITVNKIRTAKYTDSREYKRLLKQRNCPNFCHATQQMRVFTVICRVVWDDKSSSYLYGHFHIMVCVQ